MFSLAIRNLFFFIIHPGLVAGYFPWLILGNKKNIIYQQPISLLQYSGAILFMAGFVMLISCIVRFAAEGKGTLSPADPTKKLVIKGLYRYTRNPMYVAVTLMLIGEIVFFQSFSLLWYLLFVFLLFNLFVILVEEPRLKKAFGEEYSAYCVRVRRWL